MARISAYLIFIFMVFFATGCVKGTYDMNKLSNNAHLSPTYAISAVKGDVSLGDIVKANDNVIIDQNKFVKIVFRKDSVINLKLADYFNFNNMVSFSQSYMIGELPLASFEDTKGFTLDQISQRLSPALRNQFVALDDGALHPFPSFPSAILPEFAFAPFPNFQNAVFSTGTLEISITNNLKAPLNSISVNLFNIAGHTSLGGALTIPAVQPGQTQTASMDLANKTIANSIMADIVLSGSPGNATPVLISLSNSNIQVKLRVSNIKVKSGRIIIPSEILQSLNNVQTITFDPGNGIELDELKTTSGNLSYHVQKPAALSASLTASMPTAVRNGIAVSEVINLGTSTVADGNISFNNTTVDLGTDPVVAYNRIPYTISISSSTLVDFNSTDVIKIDLKFLNPVLDYVKAYFGQQTKTITPDSIDLDIKDILSHITGDFLVSSPSIKLNYSNSFSIPIELNLAATGKRGTKTINLGLAPLILNYPAALANRDISSSFVIDKTNSSLPQIISMPPEKIRFTGTARMNPAGDNSHLRNNYLFGNSRLLGSLEVEVPLAFSLNNIQFTDTVDNFLQSDNNSNDFPVKPENFKLLRVDIDAKNGFPFGVTLKMNLYDPVSKTIKSSVNATGLLLPAPVDINGKVTGIAETSTSIEFTEQFFSSIHQSDKIIFSFTLNTSGNGTKEINIYSDYRINFNAALVVKPDIILN
jgi:hypothetical protein